MRTNPSWKEYFIFSKKERSVIIVLLSFITIYLVCIFLYHPTKEVPVIEGLNEKLASLRTATSDSENATSQNAMTAFESATDNETAPAELFLFDPNTLDVAGFKRLGLRDKTINTILNYRNKGGQFRYANDIRKIYGLKKEEADRLVPYIQIAVSQKQESHYSGKTDVDNKTAYENRKPKPQAIDINTATVEQWKSLPTIGDALSNRIVKFRDKIGGFTSVKQVRKTYGLSDSAYQIILPYLTLSSANATKSTTVSKKININTASVNELESNPAIPAEVAEAIVIYRKQHGNYTSVEDIKKIVFITDELFRKTSPYLSVQ